MSKLKINSKTAIHNVYRTYTTVNKRINKNNSSQFTYSNIDTNTLENRKTNLNKVFFIKSKGLNLNETNKQTGFEYKNLVGLSKHFVPSMKEWHNSIYTYNRETIKSLPYFDRLVFKITKSYLNFYNIGLEKNARSLRARRRRRKASINKILIGRPSFKHTNNDVVINIHYYNRRAKYYVNKINRAKTIENIRSIETYGIFVRYLKNKIPKIADLIKKRRAKYAIAKKLLKKARDYKNKYIRTIVQKYMQKETNTLIIRQLNHIQKFKYNKHYLTPLIKMLEVTYKKKVNFNFVNVKYIYNNTGVLSESIISKLRKRIKPVKVLRKAFNMFKLPPVDRLALYDDMFNTKMFPQNRTVMEFMSKNTNETGNSDILDTFTNKNVAYVFTNNNIDKAFSVLKHKFSDGLRIEIAGRLTRRNTAERSIYKLKYKGNMRNLDSSYKGLATSLLRGYANTNVQYKQSSSRIRIGSFGIKTWVSSVT